MIDPEESSPEEFAEAIGRAIVAWQRVEMASCQLFSWLLNSKGFGAHAIFYHIKSYSMRTEIMDIAARFRLTEPAPRAQWAALLKRLVDGSALRNRIAHADIDETITSTGWKYRLVLPIADFSRFDPSAPERWAKQRKAREIHYQTLKQAEASFSELANDLDVFAVSLMPKRIQQIRHAALRRGLDPVLGSDGLWRAEPRKPPRKPRKTTRQPKRKKPLQSPPT